MKHCWQYIYLWLFIYLTVEQKIFDFSKAVPHENVLLIWILKKEKKIKNRRIEMIIFPWGSIISWNRLRTIIKKKINPCP